MCDPDTCPIMQLATEGANDDGLQELARRLRPDLDIRVRVFHLKQAIEQIGPDLRSLDGYFCLCAVTLPYGEEDIAAVEGDERHYRQNIRCHIDLGVSAVAAYHARDASLEETARRALHEYCRVDIMPAFWDAQAQLRIRQQLGIDLPLKFWDSDTKGLDTRVFVIILPDDAVSATGQDGVLRYSTADGTGSQAPARQSTALQEPAGKQSGGKSVGDWKRCQDEFKHLGKLPKPWIFIRSSRDKDTIYFLNTETQATTMERPLPAGWTKHTSKSTGKTYYFHAQRRQSMFEFPPPE